jgi:hypothetical protein
MTFKTRFIFSYFLATVAFGFLFSIAAPHGRGDSLTDATARIDSLVLSDLQKHGQEPNAPATDPEFLRRVYLDVIGRIPTPEEIAAFHDDAAPNRRSRLIDQLLESDGQRSHMFNWLAEMLRVKDNLSRSGPAYTYHAWLKEQIRTNRPWNHIVHEMLTASGRFGENGATGYLLRDAGTQQYSIRPDCVRS